MGDLHICGFEIPVAANGFTSGSKPSADAKFAVNGQLSAASLYITEEISVSTPELPITTARAIESLCRRGANGHAWRANEDGATSRWSSAGLGTITASPNFSAVEYKFGTHSFLQAFGAIGDVSVATVGSKYTVASWAKVGAGAWQHQILRSDGTKWIDGVVTGGSLNIGVTASVFQILEPGSGSVYFDDLVWLPFEIPDSWAADWAATTRPFSELPFLEVSGDLLGDYRVEKALVGCRIQATGQVEHDGTLQGSATVSLDVLGEARTEAS